MNKETLLQLSSIDKYFVISEDKKQKILHNINLEIKAGEILAILGKSGSGKSTLLRIITGIYPPSKGKIKVPTGANMPSISMVFQTFALFPWLNVLENVELGLESSGKVTATDKIYAQECINLIGLDGFESAMPRELSGNMKQRVCLARSLASYPDILLLDEPFSALDVLTASTLKRDFLKLWAEQKINVKSIILVTHNIEEAISMADRIVILGKSPAGLMEELKITAERPRDLKSLDLQNLADKIYYYMTQSDDLIFMPNSGKSKTFDINQILPPVLPNEMFSLMELLNMKEQKGSAQISDLVQKLHMKMQQVMRLAETLNLFKFANTKDAGIKLTKSGKLFIESDEEHRKILFAKLLLTNIPLSNYIIKIIKERPEKIVPKKRFKTHLEDYMTTEQATSTLNAIIAWGRYAEIFAYDDNKQIFWV